MGKDYKESVIISRLNEGIKDMSKLYDQPYIKYLGSTLDTKKLYSDVIALYLKDHKHLFDNKYILPRERERNGKYIQKTHGQLTIDEKAMLYLKKYKPRRDEEWFAKSLYDSESECLGKIIDYQTPIEGDNLGAVDLLSFNKKNGQLFLIELKGKKNRETMLRAILEICTYYLQINKDKLKNELIAEGKCADIKKIRKVVLIFEESPLFEQYQKTKFVSDLAEILKVDIFVIRMINDEVNIINATELL